MEARGWRGGPGEVEAGGGEGHFRTVEIIPFLRSVLEPRFLSCCQEIMWGHHAVVPSKEGAMQGELRGDKRGGRACDPADSLQLVIIYLL